MPGLCLLGDWQQRDGNRCIEPELLPASLLKRGYPEAHVSTALHKLETAADVTTNRGTESGGSVFNSFRS